MVNANECIGCQACVEFCRQNAISFHYDDWGEGKIVVDSKLCSNCGLCDSRCPSKTIKFNTEQATVWAAISKQNRKTGSSGGIFYELASRFINDGGVVFGAAFNENLKLVHLQCEALSELNRICKSKYVHSNMSGVYKQIENCLQRGLMVMFVGTPCQVSAVKNIFTPRYDKQLVLIDFLCHGTGTQKIFDLCIKNTEKQQNGKIVDFSFRAKSKKAEHSFIYKIKHNNTIKTVTGYSFEFPYYYSYLRYNIFNESCYECLYPTIKRVGDITLGDFWGIQNYHKQLRDYEGVSMLSINTNKGRKLFEQITPYVLAFEYPIEMAVVNNQAFRERECVCSQNAKHELVSVLQKQGESALIAYLTCPNITKEIIYAKTPTFVKKCWNRIRGRK